MKIFLNRELTIRLPRSWGVMVLSAVALVVGGVAPLAAQSLTPFSNRDPIPPQLDPMYQRGERFLVATQNADGSWGDNYGSQPGVVGLAVKALMGRGEDPNTGPNAVAIRRGLEFILSQQDQATGYIGQSMYNHGFAATALAEAYGEVRMPGLGAALQRSVDLILTSQRNNRHGSWRYNPNSMDADTSVAGAVVVALFAARNAGVYVPDESIRRALDYFDRMRAPSGGYGYTTSSAPNFNRTAIGVLVFSLAGRDDESHQEDGLSFLSRNLSYRDSTYPFYFEYYMAQALFQKCPETWREWNALNIRYMASTQSPDGSWTSSKGTTFSTAGALLSLALNYRYLPIYER